jgi:hypothetical protein
VGSSLKFDFATQRQRPNKVRIPQKAEQPNTPRKATPIKRSVSELLLQAWSTAISQTTNKIIAIALRTFSMRRSPLDYATKLADYLVVAQFEL